MKRKLVEILVVLVILVLCIPSAAAERTHGSVQHQRYDGYVIRQGVDVSEHNGKIDWRTVAASGQVDFAFIRVGYRGYESGGLYPDNRYRENLIAALNEGLDVGVYIYSQAITPAEAQKEAKYVLELLGENVGRITLPVMLDMEYAESNGYVGRLYNAKLNKAELTEICNAFCSTIRSAGLKPGVYANAVMLSEKVNAASINGDIWLANYAVETDYAGDYAFWQYTSNGGVYGFEGAVDRDYWYYAPPEHSAVRATELRLSEHSMEISAGENVQLTAQLYPSDSIDSVRFYSEDPMVAYVDKVTGEVYGFREGQTCIWAETWSGLRAECSVMVRGVRDGEKTVHIVSAPDTIYSGNDTRTALKVASEGVCGTTAYVSTDLLNLRAMPNTDYTPIGKIPRGEKVLVLDSLEANGMTWLAVQRELDGQKGFVADGYLENITTSATLLTEGVDYQAVYTSNDRAGTATVAICGIGAYSGSDSADFTIIDFQDVHTNDWFFDTVCRAVQNGTMKGTSSTTFSPNTPTNRAMMVTVLYRKAGEPLTATVPFDDVAESDWYADAVAWAAENGIDPGIGNHRFDPEGMLTRAQMVTMMYQYMKYIGYTVEPERAAGQRFADWNQVPENMKDAVSWAIRVGLIQGMSTTELSPLSGATRAQMCTVLARLEDLMEQTPVQNPGQSDDFILAGD